MSQLFLKHIEEYGLAVSNPHCLGEAVLEAGKLASKSAATRWEDSFLRGMIGSRGFSVAVTCPPSQTVLCI